VSELYLISLNMSMYVTNFRSLEQHSVRTYA